MTDPHHPTATWSCELACEGWLAGEAAWFAARHRGRLPLQCPYPKGTIRRLYWYEAVRHYERDETIA